jgi:hypothetical protein
MPLENVRVGANKNRVEISRLQRRKAGAIRGLMRQLIVLAATLAVAAPALSGDSVQVGLHGLSLRFSPATCKVFNVTYTLALGRNDYDPTNGELLFAPQAYTHATYLRLEWEVYPEPMFMPCGLNIPPFQDANLNGFHDFFEVSQAVTSTKTSGGYEDPLYGESPIYATWSRAAGNNKGTCKLELPIIGLTFNHEFELIQFQGTLTYTYAGTNLTGSVELSQTLNPANSLAGSAALTRVDADHLELAAGTWTNALGQTLDYQALEPLGRYSTNYTAFFAFADGDPDTGEADYTDWLLMISDANDSDSDGIPDFSDPVTQAQQPKLSIQLSGSAVLVTIAGEAGRLYELQGLSSLSQTNWTTQLSVRLTNATQAVSLPLPATRTSFWRAKTQ